MDLADLENLEERLARLRTDLQTMISEAPSEIVADLKAADNDLESAAEELDVMISDLENEVDDESEGE